MNIIFKYRMLSDESDNFVRDFEVYPDMTLADFSRFLLQALRYDDCMVSIFKSDAEWRPVEEFSEIDMGDDIPDLECMRKVGIPVCPADAAMEVIEASRYVSEFDGGHGAVRDIVEQVLRAQNKWAKNLKGVLGVPTK